MIPKPNKGECSEYFERYINKVDGDPLVVHEKNIKHFISLLSDSNLNLDYRYAPKKWTIRESFIHIIDTDKIFAYRALRIARGDVSPLAGFDQDEYIENNDFSHLTAEDIIALLKTAMHSSLVQYRHLLNSELTKTGVASNHLTSVRAIVYMAVGHSVHHLQLFASKYGLK